MEQSGESSSFEKALSVSIEDISLYFRGFPPCPWNDFLLNPRRLRGSDFLMRWSQGVWSERRLVEAVNATNIFYALPYGPSSVAPEDDVRRSELYFERLDKAGLGNVKRPDLLIFHSDDQEEIQRTVNEIGGQEELPFTPETDNRMRQLTQKAILAVECENSLWVAEKMPNFQEELRPMRRLGGKLGLPKNAVLPTIIIKEEDRTPLMLWQKQQGVPIHVWHVFYDRAYGISLDEAEKLFRDGLIEATEQTFQAPGGASSKKSIYKIYHHYCYELGVSKDSPELVAAFIEDKNGHILPYVKFEGGSFDLKRDALDRIERVDSDRMKK
ncbi:MAG: AccI family restriction endonuclease [Candidatus Dadabacteria bacterium]|nr:AccI family restriction endonuclease [Candidatus Dadabacteria bacterium]MYA48783.1 AccI family restriction endonuclease [Candidatus Dadabacteria bacterium]MYK49341.1 AccI family restriction endonuclease [Candidatus Dadabacteria bacterium]